MAAAASPRGWRNYRPRPSNGMNCKAIGMGGTVGPLAEVIVRSKSWDVRGTGPAPLKFRF